MKKILLPTDFSDNAWNAIVYALKLYKNQKCKFVLLNTYTPMIYNIDYMEITMELQQMLLTLSEKHQKKD